MGFPRGAVGRASVSTRRPQALAVCDRCGTWYNRKELRWQFEWAGRSLQNQQILVCYQCLDVPNQQLRTFVPPPDPMPVWQPRPEMSDMGPTPQAIQDSDNNFILDSDGDEILDAGNVVVGAPIY